MEIQGSRKLQPEEIRGMVAEESGTFYKDASQLMKHYNIRTNNTLGTDDVKNMQTDVLRKMEETAIRNKGSMLYGRNAAEAFERAVIQYCDENPLQFVFPEIDWWQNSAGTNRNSFS